MLGLIGSVAGIALGAALAELALRLLGGDLGGGYFRGRGTEHAMEHWRGRWLYGALGVLAALVGGWWPARAAQALPEAQTLKGLGATAAGGGAHRITRCCWL